MNYLFSRNRTPAHPFRFALVLVFAVVAAVAVLQWLAPNAFAPIAARITAPLLHLYSAAFSSNTTILAEELARLRAENEFLRALAAARISETAPVSENTTIAPVLARPRWSAYDTLLVGAGYGDGVHIGARVFTSGFVLGEVAEVYGDTSLVSLYSTAGKKTLAQIGGAIPIELVGAGGGAFEAIVASDVPVAVSDGAFAPALSAKLFAIVDAISEAREGTKKLYARLPVNMFELRSVEIDL